MDPLTAIGLTASIVQFLDFTSKIVSKDRWQLDSEGTVSGRIESKDVAAIIAELQNITNKLPRSDFFAEGTPNELLQIPPAGEH
jgi:hypothetical protein